MNKRIMSKTLCTVTALLMAAAAIPAGGIADSLGIGTALTASADSASEITYLEISTPEELLAFAESVYQDEGHFNPDYEGNENLNAKLTADIDMSEVENFTPIGKGIVLYHGIFDGQGHSIKNLTINSSLRKVGLFSCLSETAQIRNLNIESGTINSTYSTSDIINLTGVGAIAGTTNEGTVIEYCTNNANVTSSVVPAGGIVGYSQSGTTLSHCMNTGVIESTSFTGGICGNTLCDITDCANYAKIGTASSYGNGGIAGYINSAVTFKNCLNNGQILTGSYATGRIYGMNPGKIVTVENCYADVTSDPSGAEYMPLSQLSSGAAAYKLGWYQYLGSETRPSPVAALASDMGNKVLKYTFDYKDSSKTDNEVYVNYGSKFSSSMIPGNSFWVDEAEQKSAVKFSPATKDHTFTERTVAAITAQNMTLNDSAALNYYASLDEIAVAENNFSFKLTVTQNGTDTVITKYDTVTIDGKDYAKYTYDIPIKNLSDDISAVVSYGSAESEVCTKNAKDYLYEVYEQGGNDKAIVAAILNYSAQAQIFKGYNTDSLINADLDDADKQLTTKTPDDFTPHGVRYEEGIYDTATIGYANLDMLSQTRIKVYFKLSDEMKETASVGGKLFISYTLPNGNTGMTTVISGYPISNSDGTKIGIEGDWYYFETPGISPADYPDKLKLTFGLMESGVIKDGGAELEYSVFDYLANKCEKSDTGMDMLVAAIYNYYTAFVNY
ncbi:MAG: hypothetical protein ACI4JW_01975 [Oscillospiraceae bacterium]